MASFEAAVSLTSEQDPCAVFDFLLRPVNVVRITSPDMGLSLLDAPEVLEHGSRVEFQVQAYGQVQRFVHEIIELDRPRRFTEQQVTGPMRNWVHEHLVEVDKTGGVAVIDRIVFEPPGGLLGLMVTEKRILSSLKAGFDHRHRELKKLLGQESRLERG